MFSLYMTISNLGHHSSVRWQGLSLRFSHNDISHNNALLIFLLLIFFNSKLTLGYKCNHKTSLRHKSVPCLSTLKFFINAALLKAKIYIRFSSAFKCMNHVHTCKLSLHLLYLTHYKLKKQTLFEKEMPFFLSKKCI